VVKTYQGDGKVGRNDHCPQCGQKMKKCRGHGVARKVMMVIALAVALVIVIGAVSYQRSQTIAKRNEQLHQLFERYLVGKSVANQRWWFTSTDGSAVDLADKCASAQKLVRSAIDEFQTTSPLAQRIAESFSIDLVSFFNGGMSQALLLGGTESFQPSPKSLEVCFIPQSQFDRYAFPSGLYYRQDWGTVMILGINWSPGLFEAVLFHELGHALYDRVDNASSASASPGTDLYLSEEVIMSVLEQEVLNAYSKGAFYRAIDQILVKHQSRNYQELAYSLSGDDLRLLDQALGFQNISQFEANYLAPEYLFAVCFRLVDKTVLDPNDAHSEKVRCYLWATSALSP